MYVYDALNFFCSDFELRWQCCLNPPCTITQLNVACQLHQTKMQVFSQIHMFCLFSQTTQNPYCLDLTRSTLFRPHKVHVFHWTLEVLITLVCLTMRVRFLSTAVFMSFRPLSLNSASTSQVNAFFPILDYSKQVYMLV